ncbi:unnamed protein product, partial [Staurois parvus]
GHPRPQLSITGSRAVITRRHPVITEYLQRRSDLCINNTYLSLVSSCTLLCMALKSRASETHTQPT